MIAFFFFFNRGVFLPLESGEAQQGDEQEDEEERKKKPAAGKSFFFFFLFFSVVNHSPSKPDCPLGSALVALGRLFPS